MRDAVVWMHVFYIAGSLSFLGGTVISLINYLRG